MHGDEARIAKLARETLARLEARAAASAPPTAAGRCLRALGAVPRWLRRKLSSLFREHWDIGVFDVSFGALKALGVYPALYFAGLAWTIPLMETALLNTQLWTAGYLVLRRRLRSVLGGRRFGVSLERLDALREQRVGPHPRSARLHHFAWRGRCYTLRLRTSGLDAWLTRLRRGGREPGVVSQRELRRMLHDPELRFLAEPLRRNPYLYEQVLLARLLSRPEERETLLRVAVVEAPLSAENESLRLALAEGSWAARSRLLALGDALGRALRGAPGLELCSRAGLAVRWLHASLRRRVSRSLLELEGLEYALLADLQRGGALAASPATPALARGRQRLAADFDRIEALVAQVGRVGSCSEARRLVRRAWQQARAAGVPARRAGFAVRGLRSNPLPPAALGCGTLAGTAR